ncbi:hypothetical protein AB205_0037650 [Aquarana catesbeiana]|uniref:Leucine-rich repeat protein SHOC-2 n=1 Tax=Aquarana catesbeiana TaxID=8400 RepID=A0A2G9PK87_AQUCT|nr:hypothetical protein AB205_0037650 [Aquarana catesbeiana]
MTISFFPKDGLENVIFVNLNNNQLEHIPSEIHKLQHLEKLSINHNLLKDIPKELCVLQNLQELHLGNNKLETLPEQIGYLTNLKELHIYRNNLIGLPEGLCRLRKLRILDVAGNQIQSFPYRLNEVPLQELYCEENPLLKREPVTAIQDEEILSLKGARAAAGDRARRVTKHPVRVPGGRDVRRAPAITGRIGSASSTDGSILHTDARRW